METFECLFILVMICIVLNTDLCLPQTSLPEMIDGLKNSDIKVMEVSNEITIMYGGIGKTERELIDKFSGDYNLKIVFTALPSNKYLSNVVVNILNENKERIVNVISEGPLFFAKLRPGIYIIKAVYKRKEKLIRNVSVSKEGQKKINIGWEEIKKAEH